MRHGTSEVPRTVILVNLHASAGRCGHCAGYADWSSRHTCGALLEGVVINGNIAREPTQRQVESVMRRLPSGWRLLGVGIIEKINGEWRLSMLKTTSQLLPD